MYNLIPRNPKVGFMSSVQSSLFTLSYTETDIVDAKDQHNWAQKLSLPSSVMRLSRHHMQIKVLATKVVTVK
jgi:hypothetical protein